MRDERIYQMYEANTRRLFLLLRQFEFLNTRNLATEQILSDRWAALKALWNPALFKHAVDVRQAELLEACRVEEQRAAMLPSIIKVSGNGNG